MNFLCFPPTSSMNHILLYARPKKQSWFVQDASDNLSKFGSLTVLLVNFSTNNEHQPFFGNDLMKNFESAKIQLTLLFVYSFRWNSLQKYQGHNFDFGGHSCSVTFSP